ncbi:MAG: hypothetical protein DMF80_04480 [Acidobacteria bacterium]|nr:MAG: hypothetical protein DMF80_04480 [Acidobacteriota bacterium]PYQ23087.1 MAG: hypothetical protein DMF81_09875 [Acidobacteriota bacterium]
MARPAGRDVVRAGVSEAEMRERVVRLVFGGDAGRLEEFCAAIRQALPEGTAAVLRGSAVTGTRHGDGAPFDADGPGTSDLDLTLVGDEVVGLYSAFWIPGMNSRPLSDKDPDICPALVPLRRRLMAMVGRPVNIQGTRDWVMFVREHLMGQPFLTLVGRVESA